MRRKIILYNAKLKRQMRALKKLPALTPQPPAFIALRTGRPRGGALRTLDIKIKNERVIEKTFDCFNCLRSPPDLLKEEPYAQIRFTNKTLK